MLDIKQHMCLLMLC